MYSTKRRRNFTKWVPFLISGSVKESPAIQYFQLRQIYMKNIYVEKGWTKKQNKKQNDAGETREKKVVKLVITKNDNVRY